MFKLSNSFICLATISALITGCIFSSPGEGEKIGQIVKIEQTGVLCKTYEAELIRGGLTNGSGVAGGAAFRFTLPPHLVDAATEAMNGNKEISLKYQRPLLTTQCSTESAANFAYELTLIGAPEVVADVEDSVGQ